MTTQTKITLGVFCLLGAAAIVTMIVAPDKTREIGKQVQKKAGDWADQLRTLVSKRQLADDVHESSRRV